MARPNVGNKKSSHKNLSNKSPFRTATLWLIWGWLLIFALLPNILVIAVSFLTRDSTAFISLPVTLDSYVRMIDPLYFDVFVHSLWMAGITTVICLLLGYPFAWFVSRVDKRWQPLLMLMLILPFWTNSLVRTYALKLLFASNGLINKSLLTLGIIDAPIDILYTQGAVIAGLTYLLFPFMVLPLYAVFSDLRNDMLL
ncbi:MAG: spermidine/putrescine ABC transporter permease PotB, partial [Psychrobacter sp.]|nr:spermidine/putrescine ABC transporter permease PotB [Psychrobacter sp.]